MSARFATNVVLAVAGGFIIVVSQAFAPTVVGWVTFGVALGILALRTERVVHSLGVEHRRTSESYQAAA